MKFIDSIISSFKEKDKDKESYFIKNPKNMYICKQCGKKMWKKDKDLCIDYIMPKILGGNNKIKNLQVLCKSCNEYKKLELMF